MSMRRCLSIAPCSVREPKHYLTKGKKVSVDGRLRYHSWMKNEEKRHALSVLVTDIEFADSKGVGKDTVSAKGQSAEPETYDADIPF